MQIKQHLFLAIWLSLPLTSGADDTLSLNGTKFGMNAEQIAEQDRDDAQYGCTSALKDDAELKEPDNVVAAGDSAWIEYSTRTNGDVYYYDSTRVEKSDKQINVWTRVRYKTSVMAASSYQNLLKLDCSENSETILQDTFYTDKDWTKPAMATNSNAKPKTSIRKNSATEQLINILCKDL